MTAKRIAEIRADLSPCEYSDELTLDRSQYTGETVLSVEELLDLIDFWERAHDE